MIQSCDSIIDSKIVSCVRAIIIFILSFVFILNSTDLKASDPLVPLLKSQISRIYSGAQIQLTPPVRWVQGKSSAPVKSVTILGDDGRGNVHFFTNTGSSDFAREGWITTSAWIPAKISVKRIRPGELLTSDQFIIQNINIMLGQAREYRGIIYPGNAMLSHLETLHTVLEGQFLLTTSVQKIPDVKRGDMVRILLKSGDLTLSTHGVAEESGYFNKQVKVMTSITKREILGQLLPGKVVEVQL